MLANAFDPCVRPIVEIQNVHGDTKKASSDADSRQNPLPVFA
jgi:hypothetical protein